MGVGRHDAEALGRAHVQGDVAGIGVAEVRVGQHVGRGVGVLVVGRVDRAVVNAVETGEAIHRDHVPVLHRGGVDVLVEHTLDGDGEREGGRERVVHGQGGLPDLRHLELRIHGGKLGRNLAILRGDLLREAEAIPLLAHLLAIDDQVAGELLEERVGVRDTILVGGGDDTGILVHGGVGRHVREEHERNTAGEEAGTAADLQALVAQHIPGEADTRREQRNGGRPLAGVDVTCVAVGVRIAQGEDGVVRDDVAVIEEEVVDTQAGGQLEAVGGVPLVLHIEAGLVVHHAAGRVVAHQVLVTVGEVHRLRGGTGHEVLQGVVAVVTGTVAQVGVVSHLVLVGEASGDLVGAGIVGEVILDVDDVVVVTVLPGEELVTEGHVRGDGPGAIEDVDEREVGRIRTAGGIELGIGGQELVRHVVRQAAVQVQGEGVDQVVHGIERVREGHGVLGQTSHGGTLTAVRRRSVGVVALLGDGVVVAQGQLVLVADVPVDAGQGLHIHLVAAEVAVGTRIIAILVHDIILDLLVQACLLLQLFHIEGIGQETDVKDHIRVLRDAVLVAEGLDRHIQVFIFPVMFKDL